MRIEAMKVNGIREPIGYQMDSIRLSFRVREAKGKRTENIHVKVSSSASFSDTVYETEGKLDTACIPLQFSPRPRTRYFIRAAVKDDLGDEASGETWFETSKQDEPWRAKWIGTREEDTFHPVFAKSFRAGKDIQLARLYITGLGLYAADLNGKKIGQELLTPNYSDYRTEIQYQTYDITDQLQEENRLEVRLADGWFKGVFGLDRRRDNFGTGFHFLAELRIVYADGTESIIGTDESWAYRGGDTEESGIYDGQIINRLLWADRENPWKRAVESPPEGHLTARYSVPVMEMEELPVREVIHTPAGETVLDFGQNFGGYVRFRSPERNGAKIVLDFGEILQEGSFYRENYRSAKSRFTYVSDGRKEWVKPEFTYFGFRYVRVTGWEGELNPDDFTGVVIYSRMERTGWIETGHEKVNRLYLNALWGQKSNFIDFPTDCPQRDERLGWTGDCQVFSGTASYNMDTAAFYQKFLHDLRTEQKKFDGILPGVIPVFPGSEPIFSSVWGDIAAILPAVLYEHYGDTQALAENYPMMKAWIDKIDREDAARGRRYLYDFGNQLGDWLSLNGRTSQSMTGGTDEYLIGSFYYADSVRLTAETARVLGKSEDEKIYRERYEKIRQAIFREYFSPSGRLCVDTQTAYVVSLHTGIYPDKEKILDALQKRLYMDCYRLTGGFVGAPILCRTLAENGLPEEAFRFLLQEDYPSWLHCVNLGATTIWERWNSVLPDGTISGTGMNSLNHYAYGAIAEYLYRDVAGLRAKAPGFHRVVIAPEVNARLRYMKMRYESSYGTYRSEWEILPDGKVRVEIEIPFDCTAEVTLPHDPEEREMELAAGCYTFTYQPTSEVRAIYTGKTIFKDMLKDRRAVDVIRKTCPALMFFLNGGSEDFLYETPATLMRMGFMGFRPEDVRDLTDKLTQIFE